MFDAGISILALVVVVAVVLIALLPLFFLIDMYRFVKKIANSSIQQEEYLRKLVVIAKKYYQRDFAEAEKKDADENNIGDADENASNNPNMKNQGQ